MTDSPVFIYTSLAAGSIANEMGFLGDSARVKALFTAMYEAAIRQEPTRCPTMYAENAVTVQRVKPCQKAKRE